MNPLANAVRLQSLRASLNKMEVRTGYVTSYDPDRYMVKVSIQPEGINTNYIPLKALSVGNGFGIYAPPKIGDQVAVFFEGGSINAAFACGGFFTDAAVPVAVPAGEFLVQHQTGTLLHFKNDGSLVLTGTNGINANGVEIDAAGNVATPGNVAVGTGASGTFTTPQGQTVTVQDGIVTNIF